LLVSFFFFYTCLYVNVSSASRFHFHALAYSRYKLNFKRRA
jgi:hypothetical protein